VPQAMAQFVLKIELLSHIMGTTPILEMARAYGLRPRLWLLSFRKHRKCCSSIFSSEVLLQSRSVCFVANVFTKLTLQEAFEIAAQINGELNWGTEFGGAFCKKLKLLIDRFSSFFR